MTDLYFSCDWVIRPAVNYVRLLGLAHELGCALAVAQANVVTPDKFVLMRYALRAPSQQALDEFAAKVGKTVGLSDWQPADAEYFEHAQPLDLHLLDAEFLSRWMDAMHAYGLHNQQLARQRDSR
jgi:hypothetical protein